MKDIVEVLNEFQKGYDERNLENIGRFVKKLFSQKEGLVVVGNCLNEWCYNQDEIKELLKKHWYEKNLNWGKVDFDFKNARIFESKDTALVVSLANICSEIKEAEACENTIENVKKIFNKDTDSALKVYEASKAIAETLKEIDKGEKYKWPMRFTAFLIKENDEWKFHQMQFSLDANFFCQHRYLKQEDVLPMFVMNKSNEEAPEIREVLRVFQEGYTKRDLNILEDYLKNFTMDNDMVVIGTDAEELCIGGQALRNIVTSDWKYWGDLKLNVDGAIIVQYEDTAYFTTKAMIKHTFSRDWMCDSVPESVNEYIFKSDRTPKQKLLVALFNMVGRLCEREKGEDCYCPMRLSGFLVKRNNKWLIHHIQYSDYIDVPEVRIE